MKMAMALAFAGTLTVTAQTAAPAKSAGQAATAGQAGTAKSAGMSSWRSSLSALPATPPASTSAQDVAQFEKNMTMAAASLTSTTSTADPSQAEANRALVQRMATYLAGLQTLSASNAQLRPPVNHAQQSFNSLGLLQFLVLANSLQTPNLQQPPPFALTAPESTDVSDADKDLSDELHARYETDAAHSAAIWQKAETLREGLAARGLSLNVHAATALVRLPLRFKSAANALRRNDWDAARTHLEEAEAETEKIADVAVK